MTNDVRESRTPADRRRLVGSVCHAFDLLTCLANEDAPQGSSELARRTGLSKSSVHTLMTTLEALDVVRRDGPQRGFRLGWRLFELGSYVPQSSDILQAARGQLEHLANETGETALLGVLHDGQVLYIDHAYGTQTIQMVARRGRRAPLHATASGKVFLAFAAPDLLDEILAQPIERFTPQTICDPSTLRRQIDEVKVRGYAVVHEEREPGLSSLSVPVSDGYGEVVAAMTVAGPSDRFEPASLAAIVETLKMRATAASRGVER